MSPQLVQVIIFALGEAIKAYPQIAADVSALLSKESVTAADWQALHDKVASQDYFAFVPGSSLPH